jgi:hypothetical protein
MCLFLLTDVIIFFLFKMIYDNKKKLDSISIKQKELSDRQKEIEFRQKLILELSKEVSDELDKSKRQDAEEE